MSEWIDFLGLLSIGCCLGYAFKKLVDLWAEPKPDKGLFIRIDWANGSESMVHVDQKFIDEEWDKLRTSIGTCYFHCDNDRTVFNMKHAKQVSLVAVK